MLTLFFTLTLYCCSADIDNIMSVSSKGPLISPVWRPRVVQRFPEGSGETCLSRFKGGVGSCLLSPLLHLGKRQNDLCPSPLLPLHRNTPHLLLAHHLATLYVCSSVNYLHYVCLPLSPSNPLSLDMIAMASIHIPALLNPVTSQVFPLPSGLDSFSP